MAYYSYYQNSQPTWGTQQYQYMAPPMPQYQPQPSWQGGDYYRAHADTADNTLFDYVWSKMKSVVAGTSVGRNEATHWWKRVYAGLVNPSRLLPREIGAAAGYEAIRCWEHHKSIYIQPMSEDREREREALIGLATAEATKLWAYTQRPTDKWGRIEASEVAAATAARIFVQSYDYDDPYEAYDRNPRMRPRRRSISGMRYGNGISGGELFDDDDDDLLDTSSRTGYLDAYPRRSRSSHMHPGLSRRSSSMYRRSPSPMMYRRRSPSPMAMGAVGLSSSVVSPYTTPYDASNPALGHGISGTYYPQAAAASGYGYPQSPGGYGSYAQGGVSPYGSTAALGASPYMNRGYAGSSVGLPPPPGTGQYLAAPGGHHRSRSMGSYGAVRPSFGY